MMCQGCYKTTVAHKWKSGKETQGPRAAYPLCSEPVEGDGREAACSWPVSSLGWNISPTYLHQHLSQTERGKRELLRSLLPRHTSVSEALVRASSSNPRMGLAAAAVARGRVPMLWFKSGAGGCSLIVNQCSFQKSYTRKICATSEPAWKVRTRK